MSISVSEVQHANPAVGPNARFPIGPDDATRSMLLRWHAVFGDIYGVYDERGDIPHWVVHDPEVVQQILVRNSQNYQKGLGLDRVRLLLGNGIMVSEGDFWARQRRLLQPAFKPRVLADYNPMIVEENRRLARRWQAAAEASEPLEIGAEISETTLVIVLKSIFGADFDALVDGGAHPFSVLTAQPERDLRFAARFHRLGRVVERIIDKRLTRPREEFDFLGHMLAARSKHGEAMSRGELVDEVMTLIVAGHETTASALAWAWYLIATHPPVCERLQRDVDAIDPAGLRRDGGHRNEALAYVDAVIKETLRLYPPGWLLSRRALASDTLGRHVVEPGTQVFISPFVLHRHPHYWRQPESFDPERFMPGAEAPASPRRGLAYIPFAAGPRHCVGEHLAMVEMRIHLVEMLRRFTPHYADTHPPQMESHINLRPKDGIYLQLASRRRAGRRSAAWPIEPVRH